MIPPTLFPLESTPDAPAIGNLELFADQSDGLLKQINQHGVVTALGGGGSQPVKRVKVAFAWNTPNLVLTGIPIYTPAAGEYVVNDMGYVSIPTTDLDGANPTFHFGVAGSLSAYDVPFANGGLAVGGRTDGALGAHASTPAVTFLPSNEGVIFLDATPMTLMMDDSAGGDPVNTQGAGVVVFWVAAA